MAELSMESQDIHNMNSKYFFELFLLPKIAEQSKNQ